MGKLRSLFTTRNQLIRDFLAEFIGMFILIYFGIGSVAQFVLSKQTASIFLTINIGWGIALAMALYVCAGVSGGHLNPAVSLAMCVIGELPWKKLPVYLAGQYLGSFVAAALAFLLYYDALNDFDGGERSVAGTAWIFATYPKDFLSIQGALFDQCNGLLAAVPALKVSVAAVVTQVSSTAMMMLFIMALTDQRNPVHVSLAFLPIAVGLVIVVIGMCFAHNCGYPLNPARDLSPRIFTAISGWGAETFSSHNYYFWVPVVGPHIGCILGAYLYKILIGFHLEPPADNLNKVDNMSAAESKRTIKPDDISGLM